MRQLSKPRELRLDQRARIVRIEAAGLGVDRHGFERRPAERRERDREARRLAHRRLVERQAPAGRFRIGRDRRARRRARPSTSAGYRARYPCRKRFMPSRAGPSHCLDRDDRLEEHRLGRGVDARAMQIEIGRHAFEGARAVEHRRAEPDGVGARAHDRHIALVPIAFEEGPGLRPAPVLGAIPLSLSFARLPALHWLCSASMRKTMRFC